MDAELKKLIEAGKLTTKSAAQLEKLKPGTFCLHKSCGFGRVREWNLLLNQIVIDFASKKSHPMQAQYAAENLTPLAQEHFLVRKATDIGAIKKLASENPVALVQNILESLDGKANAQQIGEWVIGDIFTEAEWKRWWESTRKALKASGGFSIPAKKTDPIQIRGEGVSHAEELLAAFNKARQPKQQIAAFEQIIKSYEQFKEPEKQLQPIVVAIENSAARNQKLHPELAFELIIARDDLLARVPSLHTTHIGLTLPKLIVEEEKRLTSILPNLPAAKEKRVLQTLPSALGAGWTERALLLMEARHGRMVAQIPRILNETGQHAELRSLLARMVKVYPELESMIAGAETQEKAAPLIVSWSSLEKRRAEHEEIVKVKIPENTKEIAIARSYGDLSENFEFKAAKQMQSVLMRRKAELEQMLHDARGTSFENPDTSRVSIGTIVTFRNAETNNEETYTILGAWDGDPDRHIISYQTAIGQALLGHEVAETILLNTEDGIAQFIIVSIQPAPPDQTPPAPELPSESAVEATVAE